MADAASTGLSAAARRLCDSLLATAQTRLELFALEWREEKLRAVQALLLAGCALGLGLMALTLLTFTVVFALGESARLAALIILTLAYGTGAGLAYRTLRQRLRNWNAFSGTLGELAKDRACFTKSDPPASTSAAANS